MKFLLDTDTCVFWLRERESVRHRLAATGLEATGISVITLAELRYGAACSARPEANHQAIGDFISGITVLGVDSEIARIFGDLKAQLRKQGMLIEDFRSGDCRDGADPRFDPCDQQRGAFPSHPPPAPGELGTVLNFLPVVPLFSASPLGLCQFAHLVPFPWSPCLPISLSLSLLLSPHIPGSSASRRR